MFIKAQVDLNLALGQLIKVISLFFTTYLVLGYCNMAIHSFLGHWEHEAVNVSILICSSSDLSKVHT